MPSVLLLTFWFKTSPHFDFALTLLRRPHHEKHTQTRSQGLPLVLVSEGALSWRGLRRVGVGWSGFVMLACSEACGNCVSSDAMCACVMIIAYFLYDLETSANHVPTRRPVRTACPVRSDAANLHEVFPLMHASIRVKLPCDGFRKVQERASCSCLIRFPRALQVDYHPLHASRP
jgi:hypothetical protein